MARVLVIEDEADVQEVLEYNLQQEGHDVVTVGRGRDGLRLARDNPPDIILLDLMLPDLSGTEVCRELKNDDKTRGIPVMMVTARSEEIDRVVGFELGADDYVTKPFSVRELLLRVRAVLRRRDSREPTSGTFTFGRMKIDRDAHRVWVDETEIELTALEFKLLTALYERRHRVQSRDALLESVWGMDASISTRTVDAHVKRLREKLGPARDYVETVRGVGYRFADSTRDVA